MYDTNILDITSFKERGRPLVEKVIKIVGDSQAFILTPLPSVIKMNQMQFNSLVDQAELQDMVEVSALTGLFKPSDGKLFYTPYNVMEVKVVDEDSYLDYVKGEKTWRKNP